MKKVLGLVLVGLVVGSSIAYAEEVAESVAVPIESSVITTSDVTEIYNPETKEVKKTDLIMQANEYRKVSGEKQKQLQETEENSARLRKEIVLLQGAIAALEGIVKTK
jgi:GTP-sensing pleiotropic transcriptional regulator CodY